MDVFTHRSPHSQASDEGMPVRGVFLQCIHTEKDYFGVPIGMDVKANMSQSLNFGIINEKLPNHVREYMANVTASG